MRVAFRKWSFPPVSLKRCPASSDRSFMLGGFQFGPNGPSTGALERRPGPRLGTPVSDAQPRASAKRLPACVASTLASALAAVCMVGMVGPVAARPVAAESPVRQDPPVGPAAGAAREPARTRSAAADARVSMSPEENAATVPLAPASSAHAGNSVDTAPLTRAASRRRVETISPVPWLSRFGPVSLEHRE